MYQLAIPGDKDVIETITIAEAQAHAHVFLSGMAEKDSAVHGLFIYDDVTMERIDVEPLPAELAEIPKTIAELFERGFLERAGEKDGKPAHRITALGRAQLELLDAEEEIR
jgi:uncharacterized protein YabN with tetrapyrrole methylase and pyrophosphatase domain